MNRIDEVKEVIKENIDAIKFGMFFSRNICGDPMETVYVDGYIQVDICWYYSYVEVFGLTEEEQDDLYRFYVSIGGC